MAVHLGAVRIVEPAQRGGQVAELGRAMPGRRPVDVGKRAGPVERAGLGKDVFDEGAVKTGVVRDDEVCPVKQTRDARHVQLLAGEHVVGDAGDLACDFGHRHAGVAQPVIHLDRACGLPCLGIDLDADQRQLHDLVARSIQACGLGVEDHDTCDGAQRLVVKTGGRHQAPEHAVVRVALQFKRHGLCVWGWRGGSSDRRRGRPGFAHFGGRRSRRGRQSLVVKAEAQLPAHCKRPGSGRAGNPV
jgi:hypothetical protein